jgi:hypothetical protein
MAGRDGRILLVVATVAIAVVAVGGTLYLAGVWGKGASPAPPASVQTVVIELVRSGGTAGPGAAGTLNMSIILAYPGLTASELEFHALNYSRIQNATVTVTLYAKGGSPLASYNSSNSTWYGQTNWTTPNPFGGWGFGGTDSVAVGEYFFLNFTAPATNFLVGWWVTGLAGGESVYQV